MKTSSQSQWRHWEKQRERAYRGSINHFMRSLKAEQLRQNDFKLFLLTKVPATSHEAFAETERRRDTVYSVLPISESALFKRNFNERGLFKIVYTGETQEINYDRSPRSYLLPQTSYFQITHHGLIIYDNGYYEDPLGYILDGYLGWSSNVAELFPLEYQPLK